MVIFNSYVKLPEGKSNQNHTGILEVFGSDLHRYCTDASFELVLLVSHQKNIINLTPSQRQNRRMQLPVDGSRNMQKPSSIIQPSSTGHPTIISSAAVGISGIPSSTTSSATAWVTNRIGRWPRYSSICRRRLHLVEAEKRVGDGRCVMYNNV